MADNGKIYSTYNAKNVRKMKALTAVFRRYNAQCNRGVHTQRNGIQRAKNISLKKTQK
ncbi:MAG: hypothetical protein L6V93_00985 [Clostridiales bacterium]|nr:MAG: hypothetical protein L6V93_00985 [Clostridiales bacterium]